jgi:hypothetical protein
MGIEPTSETWEAAACGAEQQQSPRLVLDQCVLYSGVSSGVSWFCDSVRFNARSCAIEDFRTGSKYWGFASFCISMHDGAGGPRTHYESAALTAELRAPRGITS